MANQLNLTRSAADCVEGITNKFRGGLLLSNTVAHYDISGDMDGKSSVVYSKIHFGDKLVHFVGYELVEGNYKGREGMFTLFHQGMFDQESGAVKLNVSVLKESGTGDFAKISGEGAIESDGRNPEKSYLTLGVSL